MKTHPNREDARRRLHEAQRAEAAALAGTTKAYAVRARVQARVDAADQNIAEAVAKLREHLKRQPSDAAAVERLGFATHQMGDLPAAAAAFGTLCRLRPESAAAENNLGTVLGQMGRPVDALDHFGRAIELVGGLERGERQDEPAAADALRLQPALQR